ncbi:hypothetical protein POTOM_052201 [Populus tomentosa]|uniref:Cytochrome P450 n=1 Tax=Populus tomentosa TaxID=118781 RepID=A0A8X7Y4S8_POPTO|nr:hypothetical protein POTOM_052201 [Populus tomentosa]
MESFFLGLVLVCMIIWRILSTTHKRNKTLPPPEPSGAWPLIGHLRILNSQIPFFRTLGDLADKHGPVFSIRLGMRRTLVISSWESVKECLKTNDRKFLNRPSFAASKYMGYDDAFFGFHPYGEYWLEMRKIATQELLSNRRLELLKHVRVSEIETCIKELHTTCSNGSVLVDMSQWFSCVIANVMFRLIAGKRYCSGIGKDSGAFGGLIKEFFYLGGVFVISDLIPFTKWMDLQGHVKSMKRVAKELDHVVSGWLVEHLQRREEGRVRKEEKDFMDVMLESLAVGDDPIFGYKRETIVKGTALWTNNCQKSQRLILWSAPELSTFKWNVDGFSFGGHGPAAGVKNSNKAELIAVVKALRLSSLRGRLIAHFPAPNNYIDKAIPFVLPWWPTPIPGFNPQALSQQ